MGKGESKKGPKVAELIKKSKNKRRRGRKSKKSSKDSTKTSKKDSTKDSGKGEKPEGKGGDRPEKGGEKGEKPEFTKEEFEKLPLEEQCQFAGKKAHASEGKDEMAVGFVCTKFIPEFAKEFDIPVEDIKEHCEKVKQDLAKF